MRGNYWTACAVTLTLMSGSACFTARTDARIRPGGQIGLTSVVMHTPDAHSYYPERDVQPDHSDASNVRGFVQLHLAYGWDRVELRWRPRLLAWARNDFPLADEASWLDGPDTTFLAFELYIQFLRYGGWTAGIGTDFVSGQLVATRELSPRHAVSATLRATYRKAAPGEGLERTGIFQPQLSYVLSIDPDHDLTLFAALVLQVGSRRPTTVRYDRGFDPEPRDYSYVEAYDLALFGASIDWH